MRFSRLVSRPAAAALAVGLGVLSLSACGSGGDAGSGTAASGPVEVVASFYPLQFAVEQIGGTLVSVSSLTKAGAEPHDIELTPKQVGAVESAVLVVYSRGFQPAVDTAVDQQGGDHALDVSEAANLDRPAPAEDEDPNHPSDQASTPAEGMDPAGRDPHFWLDPQRYAAVGKAIAAKLADVDPAHVAEYTTKMNAFLSKLDTLDTQFETGLKSCAIRDLVTGHAAFGYLSERYGFTQVGIAGLSPDAEPSAAKLAEVADFAKAHGITTIYAETLVEPAFADTVAKSTGAAVKTLDPLEGITAQSAGTDYFQVMRANLAALETGQRCTP